MIYTYNLEDKFELWIDPMPDGFGKEKWFDKYYEQTWSGHPYAQKTADKAVRIKIRNSKKQPEYGYYPNFIIQFIYEKHDSFILINDSVSFYMALKHFKIG